MRLSINLFSTFLLCNFLLVSVGCAKPDNVHVGQISVKKLLAQYPVFSEEYAGYEVSEEDKSHIMKLQGKSILVMFGTWCHDSEREVPRLLKMIEESGVVLSKFELLAVDLDKKESSGLAKAQRLKYTPTIVLFDGDKELGRVIEKPNYSLAKDLAMLVE